jgi:hypothetical protein
VPKAEVRAVEEFLIIANLIGILTETAMCVAPFLEREVLRTNALERIHNFPTVDVRKRLAENRRQSWERGRVFRMIGVTKEKRKNRMFHMLVSFGSHKGS